MGIGCTSNALSIHLVSHLSIKSFTLIPTVTDHSPAQSIYSQRSFLFSLKPFNTAYGTKKFGQLDGKKDKAMRGSSEKGPCWGMDAEEMCFSPRAVKTELGSSGVFNDRDVPDISTFFTGESSFQADDVEVLALAG